MTAGAGFNRIWCLFFFLIRGCLGLDQSAEIFECSREPVWAKFKAEVQVAVTNEGLKLNAELVFAAEQLVSAFEANIVHSVETFYSQLCDRNPSGQSFCLYGYINAMFIFSAALHSAGDHKTAQELLGTANFMFGHQHSLDFVESSSWPIQANDILFNVNRSAELYFLLAPRGGGHPPYTPASGSTFNPWGVFDLGKLLTAKLTCAGDVRVVAVGTHPTLTLEAITMLSEFAMEPGQRLLVEQTLGIAYKCPVFPEMCAGGASGENAGGDDPIGKLIGPFDSPPPYQDYTLARITKELAEVGRRLRHGVGVDAIVCTSPFVVCMVLQDEMKVPLLGFLGLPLLWKRPSDHFDNANARLRFWSLFDNLIQNPNVALFTNNPLLAEQIAYQGTGYPLAVVRPHAIFTNATYAPISTRALLVSRTKFMWVTLGCAIKHFHRDSTVPLVIANSDSRFTFQELASFKIVILVPWEHALMAFFEFYSMAVPLLMPSVQWAYRLVFDPEGNLGSTTSIYHDVHPRCDALLGCHPERHPYPPIGINSFDSRRHWYEYASFVQFPHVVRFSSVADMLEKASSTNTAVVTANMKAFNDATLLNSVGYWRHAAATVFSDCTSRNS